MSSFEVNPHTLRVAGQAFAQAEGDVAASAGHLRAGAGDAGPAIGDAAAAGSYDNLYRVHLEALGNLQRSLERISAALLAAADRYDASDDDLVITGQELP